MVTTTPSLGFVEALNASTKKIFQMKGRSRRSEFWWTQLLVIILTIFLTPIVGCILSLLTIPLKVRRLHDIGKSGWWLAINILLNVFLFIVFCFYKFRRLRLHQFNILHVAILNIRIDSMDLRFNNANILLHG